MFLDVFRVVMRGSIFLTGHIVMPVFACADKGDYAVSEGCTITVKFNAKASSTASFWLSDFLPTKAFVTVGGTLQFGPVPRTGLEIMTHEALDAVNSF